MRIIKSELQTKADIHGKYILQTRMRGQGAYKALHDMHKCI